MNFKQTMRKHFLTGMVILLFALPSIGLAWPLDKVINKAKPNAVPTNTSSPTESCFNFTGDWEGTCTYSGVSDPSKSNLKINQTNCGVVSFDNLDFQIDGNKTIVDSAKNFRSSTSMSISWDKKKEVLIKNGSFHAQYDSFESDTQETFTGTIKGQLEFIGDTLQSKTVFSKIDHHGKLEVFETICTYINK